MFEWDSEQYAAKQIQKLFVPRLDGDIGVILRETDIVGIGIENFELFLDSHIPGVSSTEIRRIAPDYTSLKAYFDEDPAFMIP